MASKYIGAVCFSSGEYEVNGEKKKRWSKAAAAFKDEETGRVSFKFEALPASPDWSGFMRLFPAKAKEGRKPQDVAPEDIDDAPIDLSEIPF